MDSSEEELSTPCSTDFYSDTPPPDDTDSESESSLPRKTQKTNNDNTSNTGNNKTTTSPHRGNPDSYANRVKQGATSTITIQEEKRKILAISLKDHVITIDTIIQAIASKFQREPHKIITQITFKESQTMWSKSNSLTRNTKLTSFTKG